MSTGSEKVKKIGECVRAYVSKMATKRYGDQAQI